MKTDVLFYKLFSDLPEIFFLLIGQPAEEASAYKMSTTTSGGRTSSSPTGTWTRGCPSSMRRRSQRG